MWKDLYFYLPSYFRMENYELRFNWYPYTGEEAPMPLEDIEIISDDEEEDSDEDRSDLHDVDEEEVLGLMWSEYEPQMEVMLIDDRLPASPGSPTGPRLLTHSLSEPDLLSIKLPHFSSRPVAGGIDPIRQLPVRRQKTWHQFNKPIIKNSLKKPASPPVAVAVPVLPPGASFAEEPEVTSNEEATSFV